MTCETKGRTECYEPLRIDLLLDSSSDAHQDPTAGIDTLWRIDDLEVGQS